MAKINVRIKIDYVKSYVGGTAFMTKGRKTTFDERIEIVQYCIIIGACQEVLGKWVM